MSAEQSYDHTERINSLLWDEWEKLVEQDLEIQRALASRSKAIAELFLHGQSFRPADRFDTIQSKP